MIDDERGPTEPDPGPSLDELLEGLAEELTDAASVEASGRTDWARSGIVFARVSPDVLEVRLPDDIAAAALRTPDTARLPDERGWIRFTPATDERHVADRAEAWFTTAWRHAGDAV